MPLRYEPEVAQAAWRSQLGVFALDGRELVAVSRDHEVGVGPDDLMPEVARCLADLPVDVPGPVAAIGMRALVARMQEQEGRGRRVEHIRDLVGLAVKGDPVARGLLRDSGRHLGEVLAVAINLLNPEAVVVGGDMGAAFDLYVASLRESVYAHATAIGSRDLAFQPAVHGDRAGLVGCAALAIERVLSPAAIDARLRDTAR